MRRRVGARERTQSRRVHAPLLARARTRSGRLPKFSIDQRNPTSALPRVCFPTPTVRRGINITARTFSPRAFPLFFRRRSFSVTYPPRFPRRLLVWSESRLIDENQSASGPDAALVSSTRPFRARRSAKILPRANSREWHTTVCVRDIRGGNAEWKASRWKIERKSACRACTRDPVLFCRACARFAHAIRVVGDYALFDEIAGQDPGEKNEISLRDGGSSRLTLLTNPMCT